MPRRPSRAVPLLIVHDSPTGSESPVPDWWTWLVGELGERDVRTLALPDPQAPDPDAWLAALDDALAGLPEAGFDLVAHSGAALLWLHHCVRTTGSPRPERVALVAPPAPGAGPALGDVPLDTDAVRRAAEGTVLVGGDDDPLCPDGVARTYGSPLKMAATVIEGGGRLDAASGFGPWPSVLDWCRRDNLAFY